VDRLHFGQFGQRLDGDAPPSAVRSIWRMATCIQPNATETVRKSSQKQLCQTPVRRSARRRRWGCTSRPGADEAVTTPDGAHAVGVVDGDALNTAALPRPAKKPSTKMATMNLAAPMRVEKVTGPRIPSITIGSAVGQMKVQAADTRKVQYMMWRAPTHECRQAQRRLGPKRRHRPCRLADVEPVDADEIARQPQGQRHEGAEDEEIVERETRPDVLSGPAWPPRARLPVARRRARSVRR
jgi:hypothetical protein